MYFALIVVLFSQFTFGEAKPGSQCHKTVSTAAQAWGKVAATALGRRDKCAEIEASEVQQLACKKEITVNALQLKKLGNYVTGEWADEGVFQIVAGRSESKLRCRNTAFENYRNNLEKAQALNQKSAAKFEKIKETLAALVEYRKQLSQDLELFRNQATDRALSQVMRPKIATQEKMIAEVQQAIAMTVTELPMGTEPEVTRAYEQMAVADRFDETLLRTSISQAQEKYTEAIKFYFDHTQPLGDGKSLYCLDEIYRGFAVKSGAADTVLDTLLPANSKFRSKIDCRFNATYGVGATRVRIAQAGVMLASMAFWSAEMAAVKGFQFARTVVVSNGARTAATALNAVVAVSQIQAACLNEVSKRTLASDPSTDQCDPEAEFKSVVDESDNSYCAAAIAWNSTYLAPHIGQFLKKYKEMRGISSTAATETRLAENANSPTEFDRKAGLFSFRMDKARARFDTTERLRANGFRFKNEDDYIDKGTSLQVMGRSREEGGSSIEQLVFQVENKFKTKVYIKDDLESLGSSGSNGIFLSRDYAISNPKEMEAVLFHEVRHSAGDFNAFNPASKDRDRLIDFFSAKNKLPVPGSYSRYMRADEVEARLTEIAKYQLDGNQTQARIAAEAAKQMARAQRDILKAITPLHIKKSKTEVFGFNTAVRGISILRYGEVIDLNFKIVKSLGPAEKQIADQIAARLKYLQDIEKRIDSINRSPEQKMLQRMRNK